MGHACLTENRGGFNVRRSGLLAPWRQVFFDVGGAVPDRNVVGNRHVAVPPMDTRTSDFVVFGPSVEIGAALVLLHDSGQFLAMAKPEDAPITVSGFTRD